MKTTCWSATSAAALAVAVLVSMVAAASAADFFPLDVWAEMEPWEHAGGSLHVAAVEAYSEPLSATVEPAPAAFPFDVHAALNELGGTDWHATGTGSAGSVTLPATNPYWLPEELARQ